MLENLHEGMVELIVQLEEMRKLRASQRTTVERILATCERTDATSIASSPGESGTNGSAPLAAAVTPRRSPPTSSARRHLARPARSDLTAAHKSAADATPTCLPRTASAGDGLPP